MRRTLEQRFWVKVDRGGECWEWRAAISPYGYGYFHNGTRMEHAHRVSWRLAHGIEIPDGLMILHECDNRLCVRPEHLRPGTAKDNAGDAVERGHHYGKGIRLHGEVNGQCRYTDELVVAIREAYASGGVSQSEVGRRFGVTQSYVSSVVRGWRRRLTSRVQAVA